MHRISTLFAAQLLAALAACDFDEADKATPDAKEEAADDGTVSVTAANLVHPAESAVREMQRLEREHRYAQLLECMSDRGRGWYLKMWRSELYTSVYCVPGSDAKLVAGCKQLLEKYKLYDDENALGGKDDGTDESFGNVNIDRAATFLAELERLTACHLFFREEHLRFAGEVSESNNQFANVDMSDDRRFRFAWTARLIQQNDRWLFHGFDKKRREFPRIVTEPIDAPTPKSGRLD